jgi:hypothetical protein
MPLRAVGSTSRKPTGRRPVGIEERDTCFLSGVFSKQRETEAEEKYEHYYEFKSKGYDLDTIEERVCEIFKMKEAEIYSRSRQKKIPDARGLYCYWTVRELGYSLTDIARRLGMTGQGVGYVVRRGERIAKEHRYKL